jgi:hypothetical protein
MDCSGYYDNHGHFSCVTGAMINNSKSQSYYNRCAGGWLKEYYLHEIYDMNGNQLEPTKLFKQNFAEQKWGDEW